jgi:hypothetical protein
LPRRGDRHSLAKIASGRAAFDCHKAAMHRAGIGPRRFTIALHHRIAPGYNRAVVMMRISFR